MSTVAFLGTMLNLSWRWSNLKKKPNDLIKLCSLTQQIHPSINICECSLVAYTKYIFVSILGAMK
ncbi:hypothetical protein Bca101_043134 [Brassica carinata]